MSLQGGVPLHSLEDPQMLPVENRRRHWMGWNFLEQKSNRARGADPTIKDDKGLQLRLGLPQR